MFREPITRGHSKQCQRFQHEVDAFKYAFLSRAIPAWNDLPSEVVEAGLLNLFKCHINHPYQFHS